MREETRIRVLKIFEINLNLMFIMMFTGAILFCATNLQDATTIKEILFWASLMLIFILKTHPSFNLIFDTINDWNVKRLDKLDAKTRERE